jgi:hypothetical protein
MTSSSLAIAVSCAALAYLVTFVSGAEYARDGSALGRAVAFAAGVFAVPALVLMTLVATLVRALRCDESCEVSRTSGWVHAIDAWQWDAQWIAALAALLIAVVAVTLLAFRRERAASISAGLTAVSVIAWAAIMGGP